MAKVLYIQYVHTFFGKMTTTKILTVDFGSKKCLFS